MSKMSEIHLEIQEYLADGYLSFGAIAEKFEQYGITREDVELIHNEMVEQEVDCDDSDDGYALASAGFGTDEDYGYYGDE